MKTISKFVCFFAIGSVLALASTSCTKDSSKSNFENLSVMQASIQTMVDQNNSDASLNETIDDLNLVLNRNFESGLKARIPKPCNSILDSTAVVGDTVTYYLTYTGFNCRGNMHRTGKIEIKHKVGMRWADKGATVFYKYINVVNKRNQNAKTISLNGSMKFENMTGGNVFQVGNLFPTFTQRVSGVMNIAFENGKSRLWNVARQLTYTGSQGSLLISIEGFGVSNSYENLLNWGVNQNDEVFYTQVMSPILYKQICDFSPVGGVKKHFLPATEKSITITFGFDSNNQAVVGDNCPTKYRIDWERKNTSGFEFRFL